MNGNYDHLSRDEEIDEEERTENKKRRENEESPDPFLDDWGMAFLLGPFMGDDL